MTSAELISALRDYQKNTRAESAALESAGASTNLVVAFKEKSQRHLRLKHAARFIILRDKLNAFKATNPKFQEAPRFAPHDPDSMDALIEYLGDNHG